MIPYARQDISEDDIREVVETLRSAFITEGPAIERFEREVAAASEAGHAVAVANATAALHLGCLALGLGPGDRLWTSPNSFVASANCGLYCGASVDFVDIDPAQLTLDANALAAKLEAAERGGTLPKVVVPVHFAGHACDMPAIGRLAERYGFRVIEDASHAIGSRSAGRPVGACEHSDLTVFSFHPVKIVTTGEGGMLTTRDGELAARLRELRKHGITRDAGRMERPTGEPWYYELRELGYNYKLTDVQAALGLAQMRRLERFVERRNELACRYFGMLAGLPVRPQAPPAHGRSAYHLFVAEVATGERGPSRREVVERLREAGIGAAVHYIPIHWQPVYRRLGFREGDFPVAEAYYRRAVTLPLFPAMTDAEQHEVVAALGRILG